MIISTKTRVQVSVPSRGNGVIDMMVLGLCMDDDACFRPLSGKWGYRFDALMNALYDALYAKFPSPLGEMGLSIKMESSRFPSLSKFPSPLGEMGLSINVRLRVKRWLICVSVPSRGNGVIDQPGAESIEEELSDGFRPLSGKWGYRSEPRDLQSLLLSPSFRPLSGKWGYRSERISKRFKTRSMVSVPSRGNGVIDLE